MADKRKVMSKNAHTPAPRKHDDRNSCEHCLCCSCERMCMRCGSCSPMKGQYIPLIGCKEYINMRELKPLRYLYSGDALTEYKLHTKLT